VPPADPPARYSRHPFPAYRYVPGLHPHPVLDPDGHSFRPPGSPPPPASPLLPPDRWAECHGYLYGMDLYNYAYFWEAHETWESLWQQIDHDCEQGHFLQGLIQIAAAHLKRHVDRPAGVHRLLARARRHLAFPAGNLPGGGLYMGIRLTAWLDDVNTFFAQSSAPFPFIRPEPFPHDPHP
jgi:hypothetical protein